MDATHKPCGTPIKNISVHWINQKPVFFVNGYVWDTCLECYAPLTFATLCDPRTPEQIAADEWQAEYYEDTRAMIDL